MLNALANDEIENNCIVHGWVKVSSRNFSHVEALESTEIASFERDFRDAKDLFVDALVLITSCQQMQYFEHNKDGKMIYQLCILLIELYYKYNFQGS